MSPLKGQKLTDRPKDKLLQVRVDRETLEKLDFLVEREHSNRSEVVRRGIEMQYDEKKDVGVAFSPNLNKPGIVARRKK